MAVNIVDVNNLLMIGNHRFANYSISDLNGSKIKTGAMFMITQLMRRVDMNPTEDLWFFCFDRKSFRKQLGREIGVEYKSNRDKFPPEVIVQGEEIEKWFKEIGYNVCAVEGFEADDLMYSIATFINRVQPDMPVRIVSTDRDLASIVNEQISLVSCNSKVPTITIDNFEETFSGSKNHRVYKHTGYLYKAIMGDNSDAIPPVSKRNPVSYYYTIIDNLTKRNVPLTSLTDFQNVRIALGNLPYDISSIALRNWKLIQPQLLTIEQIGFKPQQINYDKLKEFCTIFSMKAFAKKFGIEITQADRQIEQYRLSVSERIARYVSERKTSSEEGYIENVLVDKEILGDLEMLGLEKRNATEEKLKDLSDSLISNHVFDIDQI